jgi:hypothetical protein
MNWKKILPEISKKVQDKQMSFLTLQQESDILKICFEQWGRNTWFENRQRNWNHIFSALTKHDIATLRFSKVGITLDLNHNEQLSVIQLQKELFKLSTKLTTIHSRTYTVGGVIKLHKLINELEKDIEELESKKLVAFNSLNKNTSSHLKRISMKNNIAKKTCKNFSKFF